MNTVGIEVLDLEHLNTQNVANSFLTTLQSTNWKVMRCYNLVFNLKIFVHNYGSILIFILFIIYIVFIIYFCFKEINPIKVKVSKIIFDETEELKEKETLSINYKTKSEPKIKEKIKFKKTHYPPKKAKSRFAKSEYNSTYEKNVVKTEEKNLVDFKRKALKNSSKKTELIDGTSRKNIKNIDHLIDKEKKVKFNDKKIKVKNMDNFELNNLDFYDACELDKRTCCKTYLSILMREHFALITFVAWNDYNLFYIKIERFFILFCVDMTMSGLFFVH
jgi:hypothetical protein